MRRTWTSQLKAGHKTPDFRAITHTGEKISSAGLLGKKYILFFYNHDGSETCTKEACNMRDHYQLLTERGFTFLGVSEDSIKKHQRFIAKFNLPYALIADVGNGLAKIFDIYGEKEFMGRKSVTVHRTTFVIDENGLILSVIHPVDSARHAEQIIASLNPPV